MQRYHDFFISKTAVLCCHIFEKLNFKALTVFRVGLCVIQTNFVATGWMVA